MGEWSSELNNDHIASKIYILKVEGQAVVFSLEAMRVMNPENGTLISVKFLPAKLRLPETRL